MSTVTSTDDVLTGEKRKRATRSAINYADIAEARITELEHDEFLELDDGGEEVSDDDVPYGDSVYGSRKTTKGKKGAVKKRARLTPAKPKKAQSPFPFLSLPAELRDYIYVLALVEPEGLTVVHRFKGHRRIPARGPVYDAGQRSYYRRRWNHSNNSQHIEQSNTLTPNLLAVNKQIHAEGIGYLYQQPIILEDMLALHLFVASIGPTNRLQVKDLIVRGWGSGRGIHKAMNFAALTLLAGCTNLKSLYFDCNISRWGRTGQSLARQIYRDGHHFIEAYAASNGSLDAALNVIKLGESNFANKYYNSDEEKYREEVDIELRRLLGR